MPMMEGQQYMLGDDVPARREQVSDRQQEWRSLLTSEQK